MIERHPCVYVLASHERGTLYVGVTSDLVKRIWEHKNDLAEGFTKRYRVHDLVWFEQHETMEPAILREKAIKEWKRAWKLRLIEESNPQWRVCFSKATEQIVLPAKAGPTGFSGAPRQDHYGSRPSPG